MFVYVRKADLVSDPVPVLASYPDGTPGLKADTHGPALTMLYVPNASVSMMKDPPQLVSAFRADMPSIVNAEANRRIRIPFPDYMQNNCTNDMNASIIKYGPDPTQWPIDAQERKNENDRGWDYVNVIRQTADALSSQTALVDPTDDSHWPAIIAPVYIAPPGT